MHGGDGQRASRPLPKQQAIEAAPDRVVMIPCWRLA